MPVEPVFKFFHGIPLPWWEGLGEGEIGSVFTPTSVLPHFSLRSHFGEVGQGGGSIKISRFARKNAIFYTDSTGQRFSTLGTLGTLAHFRHLHVVRRKKGGG
jgi:hypothetical protein